MARAIWRYEHDEGEAWHEVQAQCMHTLAWIEDYFDEHQYSPRFCDIARGIGIRNGRIADQLWLLEQYGYIRREGGQRNIRLIEREVNS